MYKSRLVKKAKDLKIIENRSAGILLGRWCESLSSTSEEQQAKKPKQAVRSRKKEEDNKGDF